MNDRERKHYTAAAKSTVSNWFDKSGESAVYRDKLLRGVDVFLDEIQKRDAWSECLTVVLGDQTAPSIVASSRRSRITPCRDGLAISSVVPGWGFGWSIPLPDEYVYDTLSWFGHYARQYIHRSEVAKALMIAWESQNVILHPFGSRGNGRRYGAFMPTKSTRAALATAVSDIEEQWGMPASGPKASRSRWLQRNTLDPGIHQGIFHLLRAQTLLNAEFDIESVVALDCAIQSLQAMNWSVVGGSPRNSRADLYATLALSPASIALADHLYFLRNEFGAHAGGWRWWDVGEEFDDGLMERASRLVATMLRRAADLEPQHRTFDPNPPRWADWMLEHFSRIWGVTWFR